MASTKKEPKSSIESYITQEDIDNLIVRSYRKKVGQDLSEFAAIEQEWLWENHIPFGATTMYVGDGGVGKSLLAYDLIARITTGKCMPDGSAGVAPSNVILVNLEDNIAATTLPTIIGLGGDVTRVRVLKDIENQETDLHGITKTSRFQLPRDLPLLVEAVVETESKLIVIDPCKAVFKNFRNDEYMRMYVLNPLNMLSERMGIAFLLINHYNGGSYNGRNARTATGGSQTVQDECRAIFDITPDTSDKGLINVQNRKNNLAALQDMYSYRIQHNDSRGYRRVVVYQFDTKQTALPSIASDSQFTAISKQIIAYIVTYGDSVQGVSPQSIAIKTCINYATVRSVLTRLCEKNVLVQPCRGLYNLSKRDRELWNKNNQTLKLS